MKLENGKYNLNAYIAAINNFSEDDEYIIKEMEPSVCLIPERIDLVIKYIYILYFVRKIRCDYAEKLYLRHIESFSAGTFKEPGKDDKKTKEDFLSQFNIIIQSYLENKFDKNRELIPLDCGGILLDGAHRVSAAIYFNSVIETITCKDVAGYVYDTAFFRGRRLPESDIYFAVKTYIALVGNCYAACIWPRGSQEQDKLQKAIDKIKQRFRVIDLQEITLNKIAFRNFMIQIYSHQDWIGSFKDNFCGIDGKVEPCYVKNAPLVLVLFEAESLEKVREVKEEIRRVFSVGNHSIHITDNDYETIQIVDLLMNPRSRYMLDKVDVLQMRRMANKETRAQGIDYFARRHVLDPYKTLEVCRIQKKMEISNSIYGEDVIYNPDNFFYFDNQEFFSLNSIVKHSNMDKALEKKICKLTRKGNKTNEVRRKICFWGYRVKDKIVYGLYKTGIFRVLKKIGVISLYKKLRGM